MQRTAADIYDEWLVIRAQSGDDAALRLLVSRWHARLYRHARRLVQQAHAADDITQDAWLAIVRSLRRLNDPARFAPWAYRIVTNKCSDWIRKQSRDKARFQQFDAAGDAIVVNSAAVDAVEHAAGHDDELHALRCAMRELSSVHQATLALHYLDGLSIAEIAVAMHVPPGTVKSRLHHAREHLRAVIEHNERMKHEQQQH